MLFEIFCVFIAFTLFIFGMFDRCFVFGFWRDFWWFFVVIDFVDKGKKNGCVNVCFGVMCLLVLRVIIWEISVSKISCFLSNLSFFFDIFVVVCIFFLCFMDFIGLLILFIVVCVCVDIELCLVSLLYKILVSGRESGAGIEELDFCVARSVFGEGFILLFLLKYFVWYLVGILLNIDCGICFKVVLIWYNWLCSF